MAGIIKSKRLVSSMMMSVGDTGSRRASSRDIVSAILAASVAANEEVVAGQVKQQKRRIEDAAGIEVRRLMIFVTRQMMKIISRNELDVKTVKYFDRAGRARERQVLGGGASFQHITTDDMKRMANAIAPQDPQYASGEAQIKVQGQLKWQRLSRSWLKQKGFRKPFFQGETGELKRSLNALRTWPQAQLGGVKVDLKQRGRNYLRRQARIRDYKRPFLIGELKVHIFPGASQASMPGLGTKNWSAHKASEQAPGLSPEIVKKLSGPTNADIRKRNGRQSADTRTALFRPMLTPAAQYWAAYRIPTAIRIAARGALQKAGSRSGTSSYVTRAQPSAPRKI